MKTLITKYLVTSLIFTGMSAFMIDANAQGSEPETAQASVQNFDPIAATLDSLISQNYILRLNSSAQQSANANFSSNEIPAYSDEVYQKRIEKIQTPIQLAYNEEVKDYIEMYAMKKRQLTERVMGLANLYFPLYEQILDQQDLPLEFKYLSIVESALNPMAVSRVGATGLWQFMLSTGRLYDLKVNSLVDERRDPVKSTYAACQYFKDMYAIYDDWLLVIAAYNCGAGNVNRAIARSGGKKTFWEISPYLPRETRGYVPAFIAVTYLMNYSSEHNLTAVPPVISYFEADTILVNQKLTLRQVATEIDMSYELLSYLNPVYKKGIIPDANEPQVLRLPSNKINSFLASMSNIAQQGEEKAADVYAQNYASNDDQLVRKIHRVRSGEHLQTIANRYNCSVKEIKGWNRLRSTKLYAGQKITVYVAVTKKSDSKVAANSKNVKENQATASTVKHSSTHPVLTSQQQSRTSDLKTIYHIVQPGDTLWKIAQSYEGVTVAQIKEINRLQSNQLKVGTKLKVTVRS